MRLGAPRSRPPALSADEALRRLAPKLDGWREVLVVEGWERDETDVRTGVFGLVGHQAHLLLDAHLRRDAPDALRRRLGESVTVRAGGGDAMADTGWKFCWSREPLRLYEYGECQLEVLDDRVRRRTFWGRWRAIDRDSIRRVHATAGEWWFVVRVVVVRDDGSRETVAWDLNFGIADPFYDGLNLLADTHWASCLGKDLAAALGVEFEDRI